MLTFRLHDPAFLARLDVVVSKVVLGVSRAVVSNAEHQNTEDGEEDAD